MNETHSVPTFSAILGFLWICNPASLPLHPASLPLLRILFMIQLQHLFCTNTLLRKMNVQYKHEAKGIIRRHLKNIVAKVFYLRVVQKFDELFTEVRFNTKPNASNKN
jgi:hypothetical protein